MKKILLLTARFGEESDVAAANLRVALEHLEPKDARLEVLDLLDSCYGRFDAWLGLPLVMQAAGKKSRAFWPTQSESPAHHFARLRDSLQDVLRVLEPDVVVSTCPIYGIFIQEIYRSGRTRDFTLVSVVTSPLLGDSDWLRTPSDYFAVPGETAAQALAAAGVPEEKIKIFGFPVQFEPGRNGAKPILPDLAQDGPPRILYLINCARKKAPKLLDRLLEQPNWRITVCVDRDVELEEIARAKAETAPDRLEVHDSLRHLPALLRRHHVVISRAETGCLQEAIAARCPLVAPKIGSRTEEENLALLRQANAGALAEKPRQVIDWLERAFRDEGRLWSLWRENLEPLGRPHGTLDLARFLLEQAAHSGRLPVPELRALPAPATNGRTKHEETTILKPRLRRLPKRLLLCDLHTHTTWSDGKLNVAEMVDFYGQRGFDCLAITDHLCDPKRLLGKLVNLTGLVIPPGEIADYFDAIQREKKRAWAKYDLMLITGVEFNKDGYTPKTSTHLLGVDLREPIDPSLDLKQLILEIHAQGGLAIASHPHEMKSSWGKDTLYLWEHVDEFAPLIDAWEVANRDDIFNPVGLKKLPFIASSDFHKPKHIQSWKTVLYCEKEIEAIKHCIRVNRDVSLTLYRDHRFALDERQLYLPDSAAETEASDTAIVAHG